jgi:signal transduction histidine kinase
MTRPTLDDILDVLSRASVGDPQARVTVDPGDLEDDWSLLGNAVNLLLDDLVYRQREREEALHDAATARAKEEFLSHLSHDMQTPLAVLIGYLDLLQLEESEDAEDVIGPMRQAVATLHRYVRQFLDYARLEADQPLLVTRERVDLRELVDRVARLFVTEGAVVVDVSDSRPPVALADVERTERILANLLSNAFTHGESESVTVRITPNEQTVDLAVIDRGVGMTPDELQRAFEKFARGPDAEKKPGTGLGLYMSRALAKAQEGTLEAESRPGEGSRFVLTLPRHQAGALG